MLFILKAGHKQDGYITGTTGAPRSPPAVKTAPIISGGEGGGWIFEDACHHLLSSLPFTAADRPRRRLHSMEELTVVGVEESFSGMIFPTCQRGSVPSRLIKALRSKVFANAHEAVSQEKS